jgi:hypothetical protein
MMHFLELFVQNLGHLTVFVFVFVFVLELISLYFIGEHFAIGLENLQD